MIQKNLVFHKTAKGGEAIANRQLGLSPKLRSMLILIDGKRTVEELTKLGQMIGDAPQLLSQLIEQDLIKAAPVAEAESARAAGGKTPASVAASGGAPAVSGGAPAAPGGAAQTTVPLLEAQRFATRRLLAILGPAAEPLCLRLESARSAQEFHVALTRAEGMVRDTRGAGIAAEFAAEMQSHKPG